LIQLEVAICKFLYFTSSPLAAGYKPSTSWLLVSPSVP
jgi:hypothetical protein